MSETPEQAQKRLDAARDKARRAAMGPPLPSDPVPHVSVTDADQDEVAAFVRSVAGQRGVDLLNASRDDG